MSEKRFDDFAYFNIRKIIREVLEKHDFKLPEQIERFIGKHSYSEMLRYDLIEVLNSLFERDEVRKTFFSSLEVKEFEDNIVKSWIDFHISEKQPTQAKVLFTNWIGVKIGIGQMSFDEMVEAQKEFEKKLNNH
jgi:hypothetical protein